MTNRNYELSVLVGSSKIREYGHKGRTYVEGRKGQTFTLQFRNNTALRVLVVPSIDGISVIDGEPATNESRGYIVPGYQSISIKGWRTSLDESAKFVFADKPKSYSAQTEGEDVNCGVIGVKVFTERIKLDPITFKTVVEEHHHHHHDRYVYPTYPWWTKPWPEVTWTCTTNSTTGIANPANAVYYTASAAEHKANSSMLRSAGEGQITAQYACCTDGGKVEAASLTSAQVNLLGAMKCANLATDTPETPDFNLGTGYGEAQQDEVTTAEFERGAEDATLEIFYTDAKGLKQIGVDVTKQIAVSKPLPRAFGGFCKPPKVQS